MDTACQVALAFKDTPVYRSASWRMKWQTANGSQPGGFFLPGSLLPFRGWG